MKLQTRLSLIVIVIFVGGLVISGGAAYLLEKRHAETNTVKTAEMLMSTASAARSYTSDRLQPLLSQLKTDQFIPETIPSYAAQQLFTRLGDEYKSYTYAERVLNPTNPKDLAEGWQVEIVQEFINNPNLKQLVNQRTTLQGQDTLYVAQPIKVASPKCLTCHSTPDKAPPAQIKTYGSENGFGWKLNEIIGARIISIPTAVPQKQAKESIYSYLLLIASIFLIAYTAISILVQNWIVKPLDNITHLLEEISLSRVASTDQKMMNSQLPDGRSDEFGKLSKSVNRLLISLNKALSK
ncbi:MAG TPA: histidine kinase [Cyanobacteria bacterium UBA11149]|nr:histidine kinase [Cyanobacteria bacterium UBA11367]HBE57344.1 histidine kinase [Cyanobacteria bacterium UBA11366]HBR76714.1 histidine kinase [Cyanobacteria bacterium UBA11159]HBS70788.1 histidine kinase [Cyanobacteria bacterium UBA11153]HBW89828.1 histidine kinase [Cyanobacteria bacterium UBA11149]HCA94618.1 histidine kinase [Cyanobacteria bacterium UBA9226]